MVTDQEREWSEVQEITVSIDLVEAAKTHLNFLAAVDKNRFLYEDHILQRAIFRYNAFWLPLLAKHLENPVSDGPLVVPLDCEGIWHCHRLNPVRYKFDSQKMYGRILGNDKVVSSVQASPVTKTADVWSRMYPEEPFELDLNKPFPGHVLRNGPLARKFTSYDLVSAVKRQIPFTYQVSRPHMSNDVFLQEAMARYKGFLHLIRVNNKTIPGRLCAPTYDIDLMWHTHQLYPVSYSEDTIRLIGSVIHHDDSDSDRSKGGKLQNAHSETIKQWEQTFGKCYWKAGAMYRGSDAPPAVTKVPYKSNVEAQEFKGLGKFIPQVQFRKSELVEVLLEFAYVKNLPKEYEQNLLINFGKNHSGKTMASLGISSNFEEKQCAFFQCEPKGEFLFELMSNSTEFPKLLGSCSLSLEELSNSRTQLSVNKWVSVNLESDIGTTEPVLLQVFMSITPPTSAPQVFQLGCAHPFENDMIETLVVDAYGNMVFRLQKRNPVKNATKTTPDLLNEVYCITGSGEKHTLVECNRDCRLIKGTHGSFKLRNSSRNDESLFELVGDKMVKFFYGRKLDYEFGRFSNKESDQDLLTAVEFTTEHPYGKAVALIDSKSGTIRATDDGIVLSAIALAFILSDSTSGSGEKDEEVKDAQGFNVSDPCGQTQMPAYAGVYMGPCISRCWPKVDQGMVKTAQNADLNMIPCFVPCTPCAFEANNMVKTAQNAELNIIPCYGPCTPCAFKVENMVKTAQSAELNTIPCYGPCTPGTFKVENMVKTSQNAELNTICFGPCTPCTFKVEDVVKTAQNADLNITPCYGPCTPGTFKVENIVITAQNTDLNMIPCFGPCTPCMSKVEDMVKAAYSGAQRLRR